MRQCSEGTRRSSSVGRVSAFLLGFFFRGIMTTLLAGSSSVALVTAEVAVVTVVVVACSSSGKSTSLFTGLLFSGHYELLEV